MSNDDNKLEIYNSERDTLDHIKCVAGHINTIRQDLRERSLVHDASKLLSPEKEGFDRLTPILKTLVYNSEEYKKSLSDLKPVLEHHYAKNTHHPEHYPQGVDDMTLMDIVEMLCDWKAATERVKDGNIATSISKNADRFHLSPQLAKILNNTIRELGWM